MTETIENNFHLFFKKKYENIILKTKTIHNKDNVRPAVNKIQITDELWYVERG